MTVVQMQYHEIRHNWQKYTQTSLYFTLCILLLRFELNHIKTFPLIHIFFWFYHNKVSKLSQLSCRYLINNLLLLFSFVLSIYIITNSLNSKRDKNALNYIKLNQYSIQFGQNWRGLWLHIGLNLVRNIKDGSF